MLMFTDSPSPGLTRTADYQARKEAQRCTYPKCGEPPVDGAQLCAGHLDDKRRRNRRSIRKVRAELREAGKCTRCRKRSATYLCPACKIVLGIADTPTTNVGNGVGNRSPIPQRWRVDPGTNWNRYRGKAKRGKPPTSLLDDQDLDFAVEEIQRAKAALAHARSDTVRALPKIQRDGVMAAAIGRLEVAVRWIDEVRARHKTRKP